MRCLLAEKPDGSNVDIAVLACSKGAEVYSVLWTIRSARPDLRLSVTAVDLSQEILTFAKEGAYSLDGRFTVPMLGNRESLAKRGNVTWNTTRHQNASIFERMTDQEFKAMFDLKNHVARVQPWVREGVNWLRGDACDPELNNVLGHQDFVLANRFLCHMVPAAAKTCLRNIARLVKPGGHLFVSGIDLDVRTAVALDLGWKPVTHLIRELHEGDPSLRRDWPFEYWGLEPLCDTRPDWKMRYASVFQIGEASVGFRETRNASVKVMNGG
jgi:SAM-dependent methyltransferase